MAIHYTLKRSEILVYLAQSDADVTDNGSKLTFVRV